MPNGTGANFLFQMLLRSGVLVGSLTLSIWLSGIIAANNVVHAQLAGQLEPFGLVQKTITILGPSTPSTALQGAEHTYVELGIVLTALSCCAVDPTFSSVTDPSSPLYIG